MTTSRRRLELAPSSQADKSLKTWYECVMEKRETPFDVVDDEAEAKAIAEAEADVAAGRVVSHERVCRWLLSWGTDRQLPRPRWRRK